MKGWLAHNLFQGIRDDFERQRDSLVEAITSDTDVWDVIEKEILETVRSQGGIEVSLLGGLSGLIDGDTSSVKVDIHNTADEWIATVPFKGFDFAKGEHLAILELQIKHAKSLIAELQNAVTILQSELDGRAK